MFKKVTAIVERNEEIAQRIYSMVLDCRDATLNTLCRGQFANIAVAGPCGALLKRPISINAVGCG